MGHTLTALALLLVSCVLGLAVYGYVFRPRFRDETPRCKVCGRKLRFRFAATGRCWKHREV